ncbi:DNA polymerase III subunit delta [bacterium]|nr:DNA polymerase III subunit delta [bacterium]
MKLAGAEARRYLARPDPAKAALVIFGEDAMRVTMKRAEAVLALAGPGADEEMRLTRIPAADLRKDAAALQDAVKARGFFPGARVVVVEDATDGLSATLQAAFDDWRPGDANIVVTAGNLTGKSSLKTLAEKHPAVICIGLYDDPPTREEIEAELKRAGLAQVPGDAMAELMTLSRSLDPGDFRQTLEKISLYKFQDAAPLTPSEIAALTPATMETEAEDLLDAVAEQRMGDIGPVLRRLEGQGMLPVTLCIAALRHFTTLHLMSTDPDGPASGFARARGFFKRRDRMLKQASNWSTRQIEKALALLVETDLTLRSSSRAPLMAVMERTLIRIARR